MAGGIADVDVFRPVHRHAAGKEEPRRSRRAAVTGSPASRHRGDIARGGVHLADAVVERIGDIEIARPVHRYALGRAEPRRCRCRRAAVAAEAGSPASREGGDIARRGIHLADAVVIRIGDIEVARPVHRHAVGAVELRRCRRGAVAAEAAERPGPRHRGDAARGSVHLADALVVRIGDVEVARPIHRHAHWGVQPRRCCRAAVAADAGNSSSRHRGDITRGSIHLADAVVLGIDDVEVTRPVQRHAPGGAQLRRRCRASVAYVQISRDRLDDGGALRRQAGSEERRVERDRRQGGGRRRRVKNTSAAPAYKPCLVGGGNSQRPASVLLLHLTAYHFLFYTTLPLFYFYLIRLCNKNRRRSAKNIEKSSAAPLEKHRATRPAPGGAGAQTPMRQWIARPRQGAGGPVRLR